jgi:hypothetical protein
MSLSSNRLCAARRPERLWQVRAPAVVLVFGVLSVGPCHDPERQPYTGVLGYWTADARARAHGWACESLSSKRFDCGGLVGDTAYRVTSDSVSTVLRVQKRWLVPPGRLLRHLALLTNDLGGVTPGRRCDPSHPERLIWQAAGYRIQLWPQADSAGYVLLADSLLGGQWKQDTIPCPAA